MITKLIDASRNENTPVSAAAMANFSATSPDALRYLGVMIYGTRKKVSRVVGRYSLLRA